LLAKLLSKDASSMWLTAICDWPALCAVSTWLQALRGLWRILALLDWLAALARGTLRALCGLRRIELCTEELPRREFPLLDFFNRSKLRFCLL
jgi:hypothetical protein